MWPWNRKQSHGQASPEAVKALESGQQELVRARALRAEAVIVGGAAERSLRENHFGAAVTAAMRGKSSD